MKAKKFKITNLSSDEITDIKQSINSLEGINAVRVDVEASTVTVDYDEGRYQEGDIAKVINQCGVHVDVEK